MKSWSASAPANIALIKYMGKSDAANRPTNGSLSFTLDNLISEVTITEAAQTSGVGRNNLELSAKGREKFLNHFEFLKKHWGLSGHYEIASGNSFPSDCGLASSASSFAALTKATYALAKERGSQNTDLSLEGLALLSRQGSGSSCRSFFSPWALWQGDSVRGLKMPGADWVHHVVVVSRSVKTVSSSEAHQRVRTSLNFSGRVQRADQRLEALIRFLENEQWQEIVEICWQEFWDMHALFETSAPPFGYLSAKSLEVLEWARREFSNFGDGPIVTMDAGPNVHFLFRSDQRESELRLKEAFGHAVL
jgi:diphosphomevalonate decarboxylase